MKNILIISTGVSKYESGRATGLWLSELTHIYDHAKTENFGITIASPDGGPIPIDPESLKPFVLDKVTKTYWEMAAFRKELENSKALGDLASATFDLVYLAGGHGTMYDFPDNIALQEIIRRHFESGKKIAAICHGVGGLLNVRLSSGNVLIRNRSITGFNWFEESIARRKKEVPFNLEAALKERKAHYIKALIPMTSKVVVDGNLITGQNPFSSKEMAKVVISELRK
ncbi:type 1 glutamine amidotransferase domain-containing protein [Niabella insulamsoli]|uniref:type 1 glutamine amidotransferase domain-containing protein n=1 Tax=Niabella insulamsoli TaxID=3144874 RepID=UPI0031FC1091